MWVKTVFFRFFPFSLISHCFPILYKLTISVKQEKSSNFFLQQFYMSFSSIFFTRNFLRIVQPKLSMRMVLKKCFILFIFTKQMLFIWWNLFNYIFIYFWYTLVLYWVCLPTPQNIMFSALKPKSFSSTLSLLLRYKNNEQHCFQQFPADLVIFTVEILNRKLHFLCSAKTVVL